VEQIIKDGIAKKIRALLAKARGTENEHEATMFAAKAAELLQTHNLAEADLGGEDASEALIQRTVHSVDWNPWRMDVVQALAELYFSKIYLTREIHAGKLRRAVVLVGRPHNLDVVESMHEYLVKTTQRLAKEAYRDRREVLQFEKGCGTRLAQRIREMAARARTPAPQIAHQPGASNLPALYKTELQLAQNIVDQICGGSKARASGHKGGGSAVRAGANAANSVNLGAQIGGRGGARMLGGR